jgi:PilZ domain
MALWQPNILGFSGSGKQGNRTLKWLWGLSISLRGEMSSRNRALAWDQFPAQPEASTRKGAAPDVQEQPELPRAPALRVMPLLRTPQPRRFVRVPTHAVGVHLEKRECPRATLKLPLKLRSVSGQLEDYPVTLVTQDISSSGVFFLCPKTLAVGREIELDIVLVSRPLGYGNVVVSSKARVRRVEPANMPGWFGIAASFDDFAFDRDDHIPGWFSAD